MESGSIEEAGGRRWHQNGGEEGSGGRRAVELLYHRLSGGSWRRRVTSKRGVVRAVGLLGVLPEGGKALGLFAERWRVKERWCTLLTLCYVIPARRNPRFQVTIDQVIGGARGIKSMVWETSNLDADEVRDKKALMTRNVIFCVHCCYTCLLPVRII